ncbi:hypothetical protein C1H46_029176 [Malus baccata]|uniref:Uncharacterized protein n=1 Tax=Malus baccata TaxID=106549 RepID=A0A540LFK2_MALBA|nr:hypothetical protein C1H46_029176 [Malus baccata]
MIHEQQERMKKLKAEKFNQAISLLILIGGIRGMIRLLWETSLLDPDEGIPFRGLPILEFHKVLTAANPCGEPLP